MQLIHLKEIKGGMKCLLLASESVYGFSMCVQVGHWMVRDVKTEKCKVHLDHLKAL